MSLHAFYSAVGVLCLLAEIGLLAILLGRRQYRSFPIFTLYFAYNFVSDLVIGLSAAMSSAHLGQTLQLASLPLQYFLELGVLLEIAWNVLRPAHTSLPKGTMRFLAMIGIIAVVWGALLAWQVHDASHRIEDIKRPLDLTVGFLRMLVFAVTAGFAQLLGIGWRNKVLRLATTLSLYSAMDLMVSLAERHGSASALEPLRAVAYLLEMSLLVWVFTTKDVRRREFNPQMEQILVTLAGRAKLARTALVRMQVK